MVFAREGPRGWEKYKRSVAPVQAVNILNISSWRYVECYSQMYPAEWEVMGKRSILRQESGSVKKIVCHHFHVNASNLKPVFQEAK